MLQLVKPFEGAHMTNLLTAEHLAWIGSEQPPVEVEVTRRDIVKYAIATEQTQDKYLQGDEAPPMFIFNLFGALKPLSEMRRDGLPRGGAGPKLPLNRVMAGGTELKLHKAIEPGDQLIAVQRITDMYEKAGASGALIFTERTLEVKTRAGQLVLQEIQTSIAR
jgi:3-methylfumaryl-CoA hydratase